MATVGRMVFLTFEVCTWEERAELRLVGAGTGEVSFLSIRSHVACVLNRRKMKLCGSSRENATVQFSPVFLQLFAWKSGHHSATSSVLAVPVVCLGVACGACEIWISGR